MRNSYAFPADGIRISEMPSAIARRADYAEAYYMLGTVLNRAEKVDEAAAALRKPLV